MPTEIQFRDAQPSDVVAAVPLMYSSGPHEYDYVYAVSSRTAQDYLAFAFPTGQGFSSYHICTVAVVDGHVVGIGACHSGKDNSSIDRGNLANMWRFYNPGQFLGAARRGLHMVSILPPPGKDTDYISQVGVREDFRGQGIGTALMQHQIQLSRAKGRRTCALDVAVTNPGAQKLYERLGFQVVQERRWKYGYTRSHVPDQRRMELILY